MHIHERLAEAAIYRTNLLLARATAFRYDRAPKKSPLDPELQTLLDHLNRDGFVKIPFFADEVDTVSEQIRSVFDQSNENDPRVVGQNIQHPFLFTPVATRVLREERLNRLIQAYLGQDATFDFAQIFRIPASTDNATLSGRWHHDRVGKRLKLFVYMHDVAKGQRITHYAKGSHKKEHLRWSHGASRFTDEEVKRDYPVELFEGRKGEAYLFDTNGIHRATWEKNNHYRDVMYFEFSRGPKSRIMRKLGYHIGVCRELFPADFDASGTLVDPTQLKREGVHLVYGEKAPKFNFVHVAQPRDA